jgi:WhiB family redox-sensing transcriptional regulator
MACPAESGTRRVRPPRPDADAEPQSVGRRSPVALPCQVHGPDLWFAEVPADLELAKALCTDCPALLECLAGELDRAEPFGL